ncbi:MAG TPA: efflux RND transporter periplasmic adaptor subunit [Fimbriimonadaceae bacterium]|nr:efflux RND transporter periplasmic adaptor subunit [Fimbriimonadaceae bacterium]
MKQTIYLLLLALLAVGCVDREKQAQAKVTEALVLDKTVHVELAAAKTKTLSQTLDITGNLTTADDVQIGAKQSGRIVSVFVKDGDAVSAGQVIAEQDTTQLREQVRQALAQLSGARAALSQAQSNKAYGPARSSAAVRQAQAAVRSAQAALAKSQAGARPEERAQTKANLEAAKANLDVAKRDLDRKKALADEGAIARTAVDAAENTFTAASQAYTNALQAELETERGNRQEDIDVAREAVRQAQEQLSTARTTQKLDITLDQAVQSAQAQVAADQASLDLARSNLADATIRAPFSGRISGNPAQSGTVVSPGSPVAHLVGGSGAYFEGQVPEDMVKYAKPGQRVDVRIEAAGNGSFSGMIAAVNPLGNQIGRFFLVRITLQGNLAGLKTNMFVHGILPIHTVSNATVVPTSAIVLADHTSYVFTVESKKAKRVAVVPGLQVGEEQQINGLPSGTLVVVKGQASLTDGAPVEVDKQADAPKTSDSVMK